MCAYCVIVTQCPNSHTSHGLVECSVWLSTCAVLPRNTPLTAWCSVLLVPNCPTLNCFVYLFEFFGGYIHETVKLSQPVVNQEPLVHCLMV